MGQISRSCITSTVALCLIAPGVVAARPTVPKGDFQEPVVATGECAFVAKRAATQPPKNGDAVEKAILPIIAAGLITQLVNKVGDALSKMGDAKTWPTQAARNFERSGDQLPQCLQLVRGSFANAPGAAGEAWPSDMETARTTLAKNGTFLVEQPDYFFEAEILPSSDKSAFTIRPVISYIGKPAGAQALRASDERIIAIFLSITKPGQSATLATAPGATLKLGKQRAGTWKRFPAPTTTDGFSSPFDASWFSLPSDYQKSPFTMNVLQTETQGESAFLKFIGGVLSDQKVKDETSKQLQQQIIPSVGASAALDAQLALNTLRNKVGSTHTEALNKLDACIANPATAASTKEALRNYVAADEALPSGDAAKSGNLTYALVEQINLNGPKDKITAACTTLRDNYLANP